MVDRRRRRQRRRKNLVYILCSSIRNKYKSNWKNALSLGKMRLVLVPVPWKRAGASINNCRMFANWTHSLGQQRVAEKFVHTSIHRHTHTLCTRRRWHERQVFCHLSSAAKCVLHVRPTNSHVRNIRRSHFHIAEHRRRRQRRQRRLRCREVCNTPLASKWIAKKITANDDDDNDIART